MVELLCILNTLYIRSHFEGEMWASIFKVVKVLFVLSFKGVIYFRFTTDKRELPVLWHQSLLTFVQRYKEDISSEQKEALIELLRVQVHEVITPEVRRELVSSKCRDLEVGEGVETGMSVGD